jgi:flagellar hook-length control protein FliK
MTPAPAAPLPVVPFLPGRAMVTTVPTPMPSPAPLPLQASSFSAILEAGQQVAPIVVASSAVPAPSIDSPAKGDEAELPVNGLPPVATGWQSTTNALPHAPTMRSPAPAPPHDAVEHDASVDAANMAAIASVPSVPDFIPPAAISVSVPPAHAGKAPVSREIPAKTSVAPEVPSAVRLPVPAPQVMAASVEAKAKPDMKLSGAAELPAISVKPETLTAGSGGANSKAANDPKTLWNMLLSQATAQPAEQAAPSQESGNQLPTSFTARPFEVQAPAAPHLLPAEITQVSERALDVARGNLWIDQLADDIAAARHADGELNFRLIPARLGQLDVQIAMRDAAMELQFTAQNEEAASIVAAAQPRLLDELRSQGVRVSGSEVGSSAGQTSQQSGSGQHGHMPRPQPAPHFDQPAIRPAGRRQQAASAEGRFA